MEKAQNYIEVGDSEQKKNYTGKGDTAQKKRLLEHRKTLLMGGVIGVGTPPTCTTLKEIHPTQQVPSRILDKWSLS